jgi:aminocarboxymuconate-semialdehyde decarboxylase
MYTDTVTPHSAGMKFAIDYYGVDHVMYGTDYPCWNPAAALDYLNAIEGLSAEDRQKIMHDNAVRVFKLNRPRFAQAAE